jgi:glucose-6-phosphate dehydrogenase assembly protein OpcA
MEDVVMADAVLLPDGVDVPFAEIERTLTRLARDGRRASSGRALTATVVVVGETPALASAAEALARLGESEGVRAVLIAENAHPAPAVRVAAQAVALTGVRPRFIDNAVAALRLSSLPTVVWWRGGSVDALDSVAALADRLILDVDAPDEEWRRASAYFETTIVTAIRWTRLTRWRALLAHVFDLQPVRDAARAVTSLEIAAPDVWAARLYAGWLRSTLPMRDAAIRLQHVDGNPATGLESVALRTAGDFAITLKVVPARTCVAASVQGAGPADVSRVVPLGSPGLTALVGQELGIRTRDIAFERALMSALEIPA